MIPNLHSSPRFGAAFKLNYEKSNSQPTGGNCQFVTTFSDATTVSDIFYLGDLHQDLRHNVLSKIPVAHVILVAFDPVTKQKAAYLLVDDAQEKTATQVAALKTQLEELSNGDDSYRGEKAGASVRLAALSLLLPMQNIVKADTPTLTVKHSGGVIARIENGDDIKATISALL